MLKNLTLAAFAFAAVAAHAGDDWSIDPKSANHSELKKFVTKHAWKVLPAGDALTIQNFLNEIPANYEHAVLVGLAQNAVQAKMIRDEKQTAVWSGMEANKTADMTTDSSRPMRMITDKNQPYDVNYDDTIKILSSGLGAIDQGLIFGLFKPRPFTESLIPTTMNERAMDAISRYIRANAAWTEPAKLKYTTMTPRSW